MPAKTKYSNNHYELLLQNNSTKAIYHIDGLNDSESVLFVKIPFDFTKEYEIINDGTKEVNTGILHSGEYTYALFWNTLDITFDALSPTNDLLEIKVNIPYEDGSIVTAKLKDLHPDVGLARVVNPDDVNETIFSETKKETLDTENLYYSLD